MYINFNFQNNEHNAWNLSTIVLKQECCMFRILKKIMHKL